MTDTTERWRRDARETAQIHEAQGDKGAARIIRGLLHRLDASEARAERAEERLRGARVELDEWKGKYHGLERTAIAEINAGSANSIQLVQVLKGLLEAVMEWNRTVADSIEDRKGRTPEMETAAARLAEIEFQARSLLNNSDEGARG